MSHIRSKYSNGKNSLPAQPPITGDSNSHYKTIPLYEVHIYTYIHTYIHTSLFTGLPLFSFFGSVQYTEVEKQEKMGKAFETLIT